MLRSIAGFGAAMAALLAGTVAAADDAADGSMAAYDYSTAAAWDDGSAAYDYAAQYVPQPDWAEHGGWRFAVTPYLYLPMIDGKLRYDIPKGTGNRPTVKIDAKDILEALNFAFMISGEARKGRWGAFTDVMYADLDADRSKVRTLTGPGGRVQVPIDAGTDVGVKSWLWTLAAGAELGHPGGRASVEAFAGFRYLTVDTDLTWSFAGPLDEFPQTGRVSQDEDVWDGIAGIKGQVALDSNRRWNATYYLDVGAGDSELTWQVIGGIAYAYDWGDLRFAWRYIDYNQSADHLVNDMSLNGPAFGATFKF
ncbi:hypothetical protein [Caulobacter sp. 17J65-9]|uniref:hypothetical protein n=1 Tax=Caulobacter sp. 17J65-9 TaxID=2709382 RepID=UPI0013CCFB9F|nr:hypothetical protein [Caulobacter sp. 17J65-9]NEX95119.1 hypothetical protein [Caulobacter sp. 17J65-9]